MTADDRHKGEEGGLYGEGHNSPPEAHLKAALAEAAKVRPLDADGKIVFITHGMSNTNLESQQFIEVANADSRKNPAVTLINGAQGGMDSRKWVEDTPTRRGASPWNRLEQRVKSARVAPLQVQVIWMKHGIEKAKTSIRDYGVQLFYFDTLVVQLAPCLHPDHPSTIEENQAARREIIQNTRALGMVVGSGEGVCPTWALPDLDFFEGQMSLRTYADTPLKIPSGGFATDLKDEYHGQAAIVLDETRRIPLYQLGFHDYVVGTWVWRDTNYQSTPFAWKKDLFNILYGSMPMWHVTRPIWENRKTQLAASYQKIASVRKRIGFAEMLGHGWLTADRSVQYTDWDTGDRVIVNFGDRPFDHEPGKRVPPRSFAIVGAEDN